MAAHDDEAATVRAKAQALDLSSLDTTPDDLVARYAGKTVELESGPLTLDEEAVVRALAKAGPALVRGIELINHVKSLGVTHEFEFAIDETDKPTTPVEHVVVVSELQRLGIELVSFAPRWVGQFEKGVEYIGSRDELAKNFQGTRRSPGRSAPTSCRCTPARTSSPSIRCSPRQPAGSAT